MIPATRHVICCIFSWYYEEKTFVTGLLRHNIRIHSRRRDLSGKHKSLSLKVIFCVLWTNILPLTPVIWREDSSLEERIQESNTLNCNICRFLFLYLTGDFYRMCWLQAQACFSSNLYLRFFYYPIRKVPSSCFYFGHGSSEQTTACILDIDSLHVFFHFLL